MNSVTIASSKRWLAAIVALAIASSTVLLHSEEPGSSNRDGKYLPGELGKTVRLGEEILTRTANHPLFKPYVGNTLNCTSCHLDSCRPELAASVLGTAAAYPTWSPREERIITLEHRVLNFFMRSQPGMRPPNGSKMSVAITAYIICLLNPTNPLGPNHTPALNLDRLEAGFPG